MINAVLLECSICTFEHFPLIWMLLFYFAKLLPVGGFILKFMFQLLLLKVLPPTHQTHRSYSVTATQKPSAVLIRDQKWPNGEKEILDGSLRSELTRPTSTTGTGQWIFVAVDADYIMHWFNNSDEEVCLVSDRMCLWVMWRADVYSVFQSVASKWTHQSCCGPSQTPPLHAGNLWIPVTKFVSIATIIWKIRRSRRRVLQNDPCYILGRVILKCVLYDPAVAPHMCRCI